MTELPHVNYQLPEAHDPDGLIAIIGEAPGADEVKQGKPFVGRSGQLLDKNLAKAGIERKNILVANVFRYQPPKNKVAHFFASKKQAKETGQGIAEEFGKFSGKYCLAEFAPEILNLQATLTTLQPKIIVTLGATALWALTGMGGIVSLRGQMQPCRLFPAAQVIPTYHPSYILRGNWAVEPAFLTDLVKARELLQTTHRKTA